jgi:hypothetical protein
MIRHQKRTGLARRTVVTPTAPEPADLRAAFLTSARIADRAESTIRRWDGSRSGYGTLSTLLDGSRPITAVMIGDLAVMTGARRCAEPGDLCHHAPGQTACRGPDLPKWMRCTTALICYGLVTR